MTAIDPADVPLPPDLAVDEAPFDVTLIDTVTDLSVDELPAGDDLTDEDPLAPVARFRIDNDGTAEWAMRHVAELDDQIGTIGEQAAAWQAKIDEWTRRVSKHAEGRRRFFVAHLEDYQQRRRAADSKAKTLTLPSGKVTSRVVGGAAKVSDQAEFLAWAGTLDDALYETIVEVKESVRLAEFRKVARVVERQIGRSVEGNLECGHSFYAALHEDDVPASLTRGMVWPCESCEVDPLDGSRPHRKVALVTADEPMMARVVVDPDDEIIPGTSVEPEGLSITVTPG